MQKESALRTLERPRSIVAATPPSSRAAGTRKRPGRGIQRPNVRPSPQARVRMGLFDSLFKKKSNKDFYKPKLGGRVDSAMETFARRRAVTRLGRRAAGATLVPATGGAAEGSVARPREREDGLVLRRAGRRRRVGAGVLSPRGYASDESRRRRGPRRGYSAETSAATPEPDRPRWSDARGLSLGCMGPGLDSAAARDVDIPRRRVAATPRTCGRHRRAPQVPALGRKKIPSRLVCAPRYAAHNRSGCLSSCSRYSYCGDSARGCSFIPSLSQAG